MNILFYRYGSICEPDIIQSLKELGNNVDEITVEIYNKDFTPSEGVRLLTDTLFAHSYDFVFSINFYPFISENKEQIHLSSLDISNIVNIIGYIGDVEIFFGDDSDLYNKMENVYRIILSENINIKKGYINVSIKGSPVIKNEPVDESKPKNEAET